VSERHVRDTRPVVLITGGSRGIGRATSEHMASRGWRVFATVREVPGPISADSATEPEGRGELVRLRADVRDTASLRTAVACTLDRTCGRLNAVVANAGIAAVGTFVDTPPDVLGAMMETNYFGVLNTVREALPALLEAQGRIVVISSDAAIYGSPGLAGYSASKFALEGWAESVAHELRGDGVRVSIVRPGAFRTDIWQSQIYRPKHGSGSDLRLAERLATNWASAADRAADPKVVATAVERALTATEPKLRYTVGRDARQAAAMRRLLPERLFARFVAHANRL
jgi:NAD(P)-dependent dehydrogenase (short-subunit alcohol dehydrogenase family)